VFADLVVNAALHFLGTEVPRWHRENHCYSCHNNGDGARAVYLAKAKRLDISKAVLLDTTDWLQRPVEWSRVAGAPVAGSANLGRIQFAAALAEAVRSGDVRDRRAIAEAARELARAQSADGSFSIDTGGLPGAPATYGTALATVLARNSLQVLDGRLHRSAIQRATTWIARAQPASLTDAAALLWGDPQRRDCRERLLAAQTPGGGWGPQPGAPAEPFDTALALLALTASHAPAGTLEHARDYLRHTQDQEGAWPETTRPPGAISYAERISTAGWVVYALLTTAK
jgi:hypothetical protein